MSANAEAIRAWDGPLYDRFVRFRHLRRARPASGRCSSPTRSPRCLQGDRAAHLHGEVRAAVREGLAEFAGPDGVHASASTWIVAATA